MQQHGRYRTNVWQYKGVNTLRSGRLDELALHPTVAVVDPDSRSYKADELIRVGARGSPSYALQQTAPGTHDVQGNAADYSTLNCPELEQ